MSTLKNTIFSVYLLAFFFLLVSCKKNEDVPEPPVPSTPSVPTVPPEPAIIYSMTAKVDDKSWVADSATALLKDQKLTIRGYGESDTEFFINIDKPAVGSFDFNSYTAPLPQMQIATYNSIKKGSFAQTYYSHYRSNQSIVGGNVKITKLDEKNQIVSGTFSFKLYNDVNSTPFVTITEGAFTIKYATQETSFRTYFYANVNGSLWFPYDNRGPDLGKYSSRYPFEGLLISGSTYVNKRYNMVILIDQAMSEIKVGTFGITNSHFRLDYRAPNGDPWYLAKSGEITISLHDQVRHRLKGTFHCVAEYWVQEQKVTISEGAFDILYEPF